MTCLALSFADDHLENGRGPFAGAADVDHVDLLPAIFNHKVLAFNVAGFVQTPPEVDQPGASDSGDPKSNT
jgi:hypothetical protein